MRLLLSFEELIQLEKEGHVIKWIPNEKIIDQTENNKKLV